jgi:hypothetical protein
MLIPIPPEILGERRWSGFIKGKRVIHKGKRVIHIARTFMERKRNCVGSTSGGYVSRQWGRDGAAMEVHPRTKGRNKRVDHLNLGEPPRSGGS